jgi:hypothetical protein
MIEQQLDLQRALIGWATGKLSAPSLITALATARASIESDLPRSRWLWRASPMNDPYHALATRE